MSNVQGFNSNEVSKVIKVYDSYPVIEDAEDFALNYTYRNYETSEGMLSQETLKQKEKEGYTLDNLYWNKRHNIYMLYNNPCVGHNILYEVYSGIMFVNNKRLSTPKDDVTQAAFKRLNLNDSPTVTKGRVVDYKITKCDDNRGIATVEVVFHKIIPNKSVSSLLIDLADVDKSINIEQRDSQHFIITTPYKFLCDVARTAKRMDYKNHIESIYKLSKEHLQMIARQAVRDAGQHHILNESSDIEKRYTTSNQGTNDDRGFISTHGPESISISDKEVENFQAKLDEFATYLKFTVNRTTEYDSMLDNHINLEIDMSGLNIDLGYIMVNLNYVSKYFKRWSWGYAEILNGFDYGFDGKRFEYGLALLSADTQKVRIIGIPNKPGNLDMLISLLKELDILYSYRGIMNFSYMQFYSIFGK